MGQKPSHIVLPAIHVKREQVGELFTREMDAEPGNCDPTYLTHTARRNLRKKFLGADAAMTGGNVVTLCGSPDEAVDLGDALDAEVKKLYPDAVKVASTVDGCTGFNPDELSSPGELDGTDVAVVKGEFGVAENGAVWIQQNFRHRALLFIAEALVIVMDKKAVVNNMHDAYLRLGETPTGYGIFISGPSKTADIEQALVFGAHGARSLTVIVK